MKVKSLKRFIREQADKMKLNSTVVSFNRDGILVENAINNNMQKSQALFNQVRNYLVQNGFKIDENKIDKTRNTIYSKYFINEATFIEDEDGDDAIVPDSSYEDDIYDEIEDDESLEGVDTIEMSDEEYVDFVSGDGISTSNIIPDDEDNIEVILADDIDDLEVDITDGGVMKVVDVNAHDGFGVWNESKILNEGQFSWFTQDTNSQIGSEPRNRIRVAMFDNKGNMWKEFKYEGYGVFGGKDYYELMAEMNGLESNRSAGIDLAFDEEIPDNQKLWPALVQDFNSFDYRTHDFTKAPKDDPNQSWYNEEEDYDDMYESKKPLNESHLIKGLHLSDDQIDQYDAEGERWSLLENGEVVFIDDKLSENDITEGLGIQPKRLPDSGDLAWFFKFIGYEIALSEFSYFGDKWIVDIAPSVTPEKAKQIANTLELYIKTDKIPEEMQNESRFDTDEMRDAQDYANDVELERTMRDIVESVLEDYDFDMPIDSVEIEDFIEDEMGLNLADHQDVYESILADLESKGLIELDHMNHTIIKVGY